MATAAPPSVPPRPSRSPNKGNNDGKAPPKIPPRPARTLERKVSDDARFAPSPLNEGFPKSPQASRFAPDKDADKPASGLREPNERLGSISMPPLGKTVTESAAGPRPQEPDVPEQTRTVGGDMKLHAPKPSLPVQSAEKRVSAVTRIDSDKAASFGIGSKSVADESTTDRHEKTTASPPSDEDAHEITDESGIPEIGLRVPMYPDAGDVQAPSPAPQSVSPGTLMGHHKASGGQGGEHLPGNHGRKDSLDKLYYEKHPDEMEKELAHAHDERSNEYAMSRKDLDRIIRETADHGSALGE
jgi:hypothetical protein